jgi:hypothetical protein
MGAIPPIMPLLSQEQFHVLTEFSSAFRDGITIHVSLHNPRSLSILLRSAKFSQKVRRTLPDLFPASSLPEVAEGVQLCQQEDLTFPLPPRDFREVKSNRKASTVTEITDSRKKDYPLGLATARRPGGPCRRFDRRYAVLGQVLHRMDQNLPLPPFTMVRNLSPWGRRSSPRIARGVTILDARKP